MEIETVHLRLGFSKYDMDFIKLLREKTENEKIKKGFRTRKYVGIG